LPPVEKKKVAKKALKDATAKAAMMAELKNK